MNNNAMRTACNGTAAGGTWRSDDDVAERFRPMRPRRRQSKISDQDLGRMFRELKELRDRLFEAGYAEQVQAMFR